MRSLTESFLRRKHGDYNWEELYKSGNLKKLKVVYFSPQLIKEKNVQIRKT